MEHPHSYSFTEVRRQYLHPYTLYAAMRQHDSMYWDATSQCWLVTAYAPVLAILHDPRFSSSVASAASGPLGSVGKQMLFMDGPAHQRMQTVMLRPLAQLAKRMPDIIHQYARTLLDDALVRGEIDSVREYASLISLMTIAHVLGMPTDDLERLRQLDQWSDTFGDATSGYFRGNLQDIPQLEAYFRQLIAAKREVPGDDLLSAFVAAEDGFTEEEVIANCMMIFTAGRITTEKLLGDGIPLLATMWPDIQARFQAEPESLVRSLGEELLRVITPTRYVMRQAVEDVDLSAQFPGAHLIHQGEKALLFLDAADHDPAAFGAAETFEMQRRPNKHLAFGAGAHQCPGANLARIEIQAALEVLLTQVGTLHAMPGTAPTWNPNPNLGGATSWPLQMAPKPPTS
jgi:pimeloyl-[acyl-carrier protein] synthase